MASVLIKSRYNVPESNRHSYLNGNWCSKCIKNKWKPKTMLYCDVCKNKLRYKPKNRRSKSKEGEKRY